MTAAAVTPPEGPETGRSVVAAVRCRAYVPERVGRAVTDCLDALGGLGRFVRPGDRVLLKVNALRPREPEAAVTTHPEVVRAVIAAVKAAGGHPSVGDSAGGADAGSKRTEAALARSGIADAARAAGAAVVNFDAAGTVPVDHPRGEGREPIHIARPIVEADVIINLPKLKTHSLTALTGAVKNMFGAICGLAKSSYHRENPGVAEFSQCLVDIFRVARPHLTLVDGVVAMEGAGPAHGPAYHYGWIVAGEDAVAIDAVLGRALGFRPHAVQTTVLAAEQGVGCADLQRVDLRGAEPDELRARGFALPPVGMVSRVPRRLIRWGLELTRTRPRILPEACHRCGVCRDSCPVGAIVVEEDRLDLEDGKCIECLCCHELCPVGAVILKPVYPVAVRVLRLLSGGRSG